MTTASGADARPSAWERCLEVARVQRSIESMLVLADEAPGPDEKAQALFRAGMTFRGQFQHETALRLFEKALKSDPEHRGAAAQKGLMLERLGRWEEARELMEDLARRCPEDDEVLSITGRVYKDRWTSRWRGKPTPAERRRQAFEDRGLLGEALGWYRRAFDANPESYYSGDNVAALARFLVELWSQFGPSGNRRGQTGEEAEEIRALAAELPHITERARKAAAAALSEDSGDFWAAATLGDLAVVKGEADEARRLYWRAGPLAAGDYFMLDSVSQQLQLFWSLDIRGEEAWAGLMIVSEILQGLEPALARCQHVFLFSGHMIDLPGRPAPRFPPDREDDARQALAQCLDQLRAGPGDVGIAGGACGGDILFAELCLERGVRVIQYLPFEAEQFLDESVRGRTDADWEERFRRLAGEPESYCRTFRQPGLLGPPREGDSPFERNNRWMLYAAMARAAPGGLHFLALWDGNVGDGKGGTFHMVQEVERLGGRFHHLDTTRLWGGAKTRGARVRAVHRPVTRGARRDAFADTVPPQAVLDDDLAYLAEFHAAELAVLDILMNEAGERPVPSLPLLLVDQIHIAAQSVASLCAKLGRPSPPLLREAVGLVAAVDRQLLERQLAACDIAVNALSDPARLAALDPSLCSAPFFKRFLQTRIAEEQAAREELRQGLADLEESGARPPRGVRAPAPRAADPEEGADPAGQERRRKVRALPGFDQIVTECSAFLDVLWRASVFAKSDDAVLITGESGAGKELVARSIHLNSPREDGDLVTLNCAALSPTLLEAELFGHRRGSFTGAQEDRQGLFQAASGGTIFLDEIGLASPATQAGLLRVLQEKEVLRVGDRQPQSVDVRVVCATNMDLPGLIAERAFREDLYMRICGLLVELPPLRERTGDVALLARHFLGKCGEETIVKYDGAYVSTIAAEAVSTLIAHKWPGNVRELRSVVRGAALWALADSRDVITKSDLLARKLADAGDAAPGVGPIHIDPPESQPIHVDPPAPEDPAPPPQRPDVEAPPPESEKAVIVRDEIEALGEQDAAWETPQKAADNERFDKWRSYAKQFLVRLLERLYEMNPNQPAEGKELVEPWCEMEDLCQALDLRDDCRARENCGRQKSYKACELDRALREAHAFHLTREERRDGLRFLRNINLLANVGIRKRPRAKARLGLMCVSQEDPEEHGWSEDFLNRMRSSVTNLLKRAAGGLEPRGESA